MGEPKKVSRGGDPRSKDYHLSIDMAKDLAMVENNEVGRRVRKYFISVEKEYFKVIEESQIDKGLIIELLDVIRDQAKKMEQQAKPGRESCCFGVLTVDYSGTLAAQLDWGTSTSSCSTVGGPAMHTVTVSQDFRIEIPKEVRERLHIRPGQKVAFVEIGRHFRLVPVRSMEDTRGTAPGIDTTVEREADRF